MACGADRFFATPRCAKYSICQSQLIFEKVSLSGEMASKIYIGMDEISMAIPVHPQSQTGS